MNRFKLVFSLGLVVSLLAPSCMKKGKLEGDSCNVDDDCAPGRVCYDKKCADPCDDSDDCEGDERCEDAEGLDVLVCVAEGGDGDAGDGDGDTGDGDAGDGDGTGDLGQGGSSTGGDSPGGQGGMGGAGCGLDCVCSVFEHVEGDVCVPCGDGMASSGLDQVRDGDTECVPLCEFGKWVDLTRTVENRCQTCSDSGTEVLGRLNPLIDYGAEQDLCTDECRMLSGGITCTDFQKDGYLKALSPEEGDKFGTSVAVYGATVVVGAPFVEGPTGSSNTGRAYVYEKEASGWKYVTELLPYHEGLDVDVQFGAWVDIWKDTIVVGGHRLHKLDGAADIFGRGTSDMGAVYVFERNDEGEWIQESKMIRSPAPQTAGYFGYRLSLHEESVTGTLTLVTSAPREGVKETEADGLIDSGQVYVYTRDEVSGQWSEGTPLTNPGPIAGGWFGDDVALFHDWIAVASRKRARDESVALGAVDLFQRVGTGWIHRSTVFSEVPEMDGDFGYSISLGQDRLAVGARKEGGEAGVVYVFEPAEGNTNWIQTARLQPSNAEAGDRFGAFVSLRSNLLAVSAPAEDGAGSNICRPSDDTDGTVRGSGTVYLFDWDAGAGAFRERPYYFKASELDDPQGKTWDNFGFSTCLQRDPSAAEPDFIVMGAIGEDSAAVQTNGEESNDEKPNSGAAYVRPVPVAP